jgi:drug/metabolite transporter (DMT)-like permease
VLKLTRTPLRIPRGKIGWLVGIAVLNPYLPFLLISWAEKSIDSSMASILNATVPLFTLAITPFVLPSERPTWRTFLGTAIGFLGIAILFSGPNQGGENSSLVGMLAVLLAALLYAIGGVLIRRSNIAMPPLALAGCLNTVACLFVWLQAIATGQLSVPPGAINWLAVTWLGALGTFAAYSCAMYVLVKRGAMHTALINFAYPLLGLLLGILFLQEPFRWTVLLGGVLILGGIFLVQSSSYLLKRLKSRR